MHLDGVGTAESNGMGWKVVHYWIGRMSAIERWEDWTGLYYWCRVMKCGFHGWGRVIWKWGWEWGYALLDCAIWCEYDAIVTGIELPRSWVYLGGIVIWMWLMGWEWCDREDQQEDWCFCCHFQLFRFGSHWNGDVMWVIWNEKWCEFHAMWREWSLLPVSTILIGFPSFQMRIVIISVLAQR